MSDGSRPGLPEGPSPAPPENIVAGFARALRGAGLAVPTDAAVLFAEALALVGIENPERLYWAGRATLVRRPEDVETYDRVFTSFWADVTVRTIFPDWAPPARVVADDASAVAADHPEAPGSVSVVRYSPAEVLGDKDMATLSPEEWSEAQHLVSAVRVNTEMRPSRRTRPSRRRAGGPLALRATFRRNVRHGGVPIERAWRRPIDQPRRLVFLLDVSASMEPYSRALTLLAHAALASRRAGRVEVFAVGTRLTRITKELAGRDPEAALTAASAAVADWSGGTRLGDSIGRFNDLWGIRGVARGAVVVVCSDGWDRGDPAVMSAEMARLRRVARRVIWVNPLKASPGYAPTAHGMAAALPYVDLLVEGHSVASLQDLARRIAGARTEGVTV